MADDVIVKVKADTAEFDAGIKKSASMAEDATKKAADTTEKSFINTLKKLNVNQLSTVSGAFEAITGAASRLALPLAGVAAGIASFKAVKFANEMEQLNNQFELLAKNANVSSSVLLRDFLSVAKGTVDADDAIKVLNKSIIELGTTSNNLKPIFNVAKDISLLFGVDLPQAVDVLSQAIATGNTRSLRQFGLIINQTEALKKYAQEIGTSVDALTENQRQQAILNAIVDRSNQAFEGVRSSASLFNESLKQISTAANDIGETFTESFGNLMRPAVEGTTSALAKMSGRLRDVVVSGLGEGTEQQVAELNRLNTAYKDLQKGMTDASLAIEQNVIFFKGGAESPRDAMRRMSVDADVLRKQIGILTEETRKAESQQRQMNDSQKESSVLSDSQKQFLKQLIDVRTQANAQMIDSQLSRATSENEISRLAGEKEIEIRAQTQAKIQALTDQARTLGLEKAKEFLIAREALEAQSTDKIAEMYRKLNLVIMDSITVSEGFKSLAEGMKAAAIDLANNAEANFARIGKAMFQSIGSGAAQAFASFGKALAKGENAMQAFLNSLIASMGQMAIMLGTQFILQGIAYSWAGLPNGPSLIAAGAALAAFGGILSAVGGGGGETAGAVGGGGAAGAVGGGGAVTPITQEERQLPQTNVVVNIDRVLNRREEALEIVEVLNEFFDTSGGSLRAGMA